MRATKEQDHRVRDPRARERALILAARKLFSARGYEATTTREIAEEAGCSEGLISRYFNGKAGLLLAVIRSRIALEVGDLTERVPPASSLEDEIQQLVLCEVRHMWEDREFLGVIIPRALLDPAMGRVVRKVVLADRGEVIARRFRRYPECRRLSRDELTALADSVVTFGFMFGFMRPVVLRQNRIRARKTARTLASLLSRGLNRYGRISRGPNAALKDLQ